MTYNVSSGTLNPTHSLTLSGWSWVWSWMEGCSFIVDVCCFWQAERSMVVCSLQYIGSVGIIIPSARVTQNFLLVLSHPRDK